MGGRIDNSANDGRGPYVFCLHGQNMHLIGDLLPKADETPRFSQLYIYDTDNEVVNRMQNASSSASEDPCDASIVMQLSQMLDSIIPLVKVFRSVKDHPSLSSRDSLRLKLIKKRTTDARIYNLPTADEIAALIVGDFDPENVERDIIVKERSGTLQRIDELHPLYLPMQYPLMFPRGEDGYRQDVLFRTSFDEDGYCKYRHRDSGHFIEKSGIKLDNRFVVPYNPTLLLRYQAHINVEFCNQSRSIKYLFKYVSKGHDKVTATLCNPESADSSEENSDEIKTYLDCRFISPCEAVWRIFEFDINFREPSVERLPFHLPDQQANKKYPKARFLTYSQFPTQFVYKTDSRQWFERKSGRSIGRLYYVAPGSDDDKEYIEGIIEGSKWSSGIYLRKLFATLLIHNTISRPAHVWENTWMYLSEDILLKERHRTANPDLHLDDDRVQEIALAEIENLLKINGRSLADFPPMPMPNEALMRNIGNLLISEELNYDRNPLRTEHAHLLSSLTGEQRSIYDKIMSTVNEGRPCVFFVNGFGSSGKTYIWNTLTSAIRSKGEIVLTVASSGIASQLIPRGMTAHSRFAIPLNIDGNSTCHIVQGSDLAELMVHTKLIIWYEAPMAHRHCFEALDRTLRDIMHSQTTALAKHPFGGKVVVLGGEFRQILPVIPRAGREDIIFASLNSSYLWSSCKVLSLTKNMRLYQGYSVEENSSISRFSEWILKVGEGNIGNIINDEEHEITIDDDILINDAKDPIQAIVESTYPKLVDNFKNHVYFRERAILSPTLDDVAQVNEFMLGLLPGEEQTYLSSDAICNQDPQDQLAEVYTTEFLNTICGSGLPYH
ncbi:uncharacterized protein G2W53_028830 [Senna tora]|uniref:ATP-dependent DNA helicase n=1 Tax=Senna tora TaxID=362788 RepID=A0A834T618_9FABA|nr:uncharacterized protein G2W53_028830 [Senna tora]